ncbi:VanZ like family protein [Polaromonas sp. OV174]|nr:VanZ like family protein [Polaromonas sp. OV174]
MPLFLWLGYVLFVAYAGLVPLQYHARSLADAWAAFQKIPFVALSVDLHADLIANGTLFVPVAFLTTYLLTQTFRKPPLLLLLSIAGAFSALLAVAVEFAQLFFPPRTVKLNDILSEWLGTFVGLALSIRYLDWFNTLVRSFWNDPQRLKLRLLEGYAFVYLAVALFPYDILSSWPELQAKIDSNAWGWLVAGDSPRFMVISLHLLAEVVLTVPLGILLVRISGLSGTSYRHAALVGTLLGGFIEVAQFFLYSGISQGLSVLSRALGVCCGVAFCKYGDRWTADHLALMLRRYTIPVSVVYLFVLLYINRWFASSWHGLNFAATQLAQVNFVPFYYHYYAGEAQALLSLLVVCLSYVPVALFAWAYRRSSGFAVVVSLWLSAGVETSKLFLQPAHPDPTNLLLACAASWVTVSLMRQLFRKERTPVDAEPPIKTSGQRLQPSKGVPVWLLLCLVATGVWTATFPAFPVLVCVVLVACAAIVWHRPVWVFAIIPAALPVFDLAPWSGRFFLDEFDALLLVCLAVAYSRVPVSPGSRSQKDVLFTTAVTLLALSFAISAMRGLLPFQLPDANSFNNYYSPYNALRIVKGVFWAFLTFGLSRRFAAERLDALRPFAWGMALGLALTVTVVLWERVAFSGLLNFSDTYRVTGPISAMQTGGAYIECFLAVATPFLIALMLEKRHWLVGLAGALLLVATTYALMVTFSRGGYLSYAVAVSIVLVAAMLKTKRLVRSGCIFAGMAGAILLIAVPIFNDEFAQSRMATVSADLAVRQEHWRDSLNIRNPDWETSLFGMGIGRFPETSFWRSAVNPRSGTYGLQREAGNTYLRLGSGDPIFVDQLVSIEPGQKYVLKLDVRPSRPDARISIPICEKWMLTSHDCIRQSIELGKQFGAWRRVESSFTAQELSIRPWYSRRPVKLSLYYDVPNSTIDIDHVRLESANGTNLLRNGDFSHGLDYWFFNSESHLQWHVKSLFYGVLFDQGWFGLVAMSAFLILAWGGAARSAFSSNSIAGASLAALSGFLVVGLTDTLIDSPRFLLLLFLLAWACYQSAPPPDDDMVSKNAVA